MSKRFVVALLSGVLTAGLPVSAHQRPGQLDQLVVPAGFQVSVFAENVDNARETALGAQGTLLVRSRTAADA